MTHILIVWACWQLTGGSLARHAWVFPHLGLPPNDLQMDHSSAWKVVGLGYPYFGKY